MVSIHDGVFFSHEEKQTEVTCGEVDQTGDPVKKSELDSEKQGPPDRCNLGAGR